MLVSARYKTRFNRFTEEGYFRGFKVINNSKSSKNILKCSEKQSKYMLLSINSHFQGHFKFDFGPCVLDGASLGLVNIVELLLLGSI